MNPLEPALVATVVCPRCGADVAPQLAACPNCHAALQGPSTGSIGTAIVRQTGGEEADAHVVAEAVPVEPKRDKWLDSKLFILGMLFGAAMFLGLPWLWKSRAFTRGGKVVVTILVLVETVLVFWAFFAVMAWSYRTIRASL